MSRVIAMYANEKNNMRILYGLTPSVPLQEMYVGM